MTIYFYKTNEPYGFLNNFYAASFLIYNRFWKNVEAAYQAQKTFVQQEYDAIWRCKSPKEARDLGQKVTLRLDWEQVKYQIMYDCVLAKFQQNKDLKQKLLDTGVENIVENSPIDSYWGCGSDGNGLNNLGKILVQVRERLQND